MNLPEGWPTEEMANVARNKFTSWIEDSATDCATVLDVLETESTEQACWISFWEGWKAALAAAPTPPVQEDAPVAWRYKSARGFWRYVGNRPNLELAPTLEAQPLYTRPDDKLRKAAERVCARIEKENVGWVHDDVVQLRAALEEK